MEASPVALHRLRPKCDTYRDALILTSIASTSASGNRQTAEVSHRHAESGETLKAADTAPALLWKQLAIALLCVCHTGVRAVAQQVPPTAASSSVPVAPATSGPPPARIDSKYPSGDPLPLTERGIYDGMKVHDIQFQGDFGPAPQQLIPLLAQRENEPFSRVKLRRSLQNLYATGRYADLQVEAQRTPDAEVSLVFVAKENYFIGPVRFARIPKSPPTRNQLLDATKLQLGELLTQQKLDRAFVNLKNVLADNGYHLAVVTSQSQFHADTQQVDITFNIEPGPIAHVGEVKVTSDAGYPPEEIREIAKLHPGDRVVASHVNRALERLRKKYQNSDRLEAQVAITDQVYHSPSNTLDYVISIQRGPIVDVYVEGAKLPKGIVKKYVPVYEENAVDEDLLNEGSRNLRDYFQTKGYFDVSVTFTQQTIAGSGRQNIIYQVNRGKQHKLVAVVIEGNHYFRTDDLADRMLTQPSNLLLRHGRYSQSLLARDVQSIQDLYTANGFQKVNARGETQDDYQGINGNMRVVVRIDEGPQTRVAHLNIAGNNKVPASEIMQHIDSRDGQPYSDFNIASDRDAIINYYFNRGFPHVQLEATSRQVSSDPPRVDLTYTISEGDQVFVDQVLVSGLHFTRPFVVKREFRVHPGDPISQNGMLDTQRHLYDLGIFNAVDVAVQNPDGQARQKDVLVNVEEARRYTFTYGFGFEAQTGSAPAGSAAPQGKFGISPRVSFDVARINFRGRDHTLLFKSTVGNLQQRALFSYEAPRLFNKENWKLTFAAFYDTTRDVLTFTGHRLEGSVQAEQTYSPATLLLYRFSYRDVRVDASTLAIDPNLVPLFSRPVRVGMPSFTLIRDKRDDPLDAHKGNYTTFDTGVSSGIFGSEASFGRMLVNNSTYHEFRRSKWVFARATQIGVQEPFGGQTIIPLPERFFGGGGNSLRGFAINQAGPRDLQTGFPLGGDGLFVNQIELRFPPLSLPLVNDNLSTVLFHDVGNVFAAAGDVFPSLFRVSQRNRQQCQTGTGTAPCDFNYASHDVGGGLRYRTPIGPVRVDFGYNLNPPTFPIRRVATFETLKHFNFFFSIGQTF
jgi:outer membrane protein assembly complex protein YaeT